MPQVDEPAALCTSGAKRGKVTGAMGFKNTEIRSSLRAEFKFCCDNLPAIDRAKMLRMPVRTGLAPLAMAQLARGVLECLAIGNELLICKKEVLCFDDH